MVQSAEPIQAPISTEQICKLGFLFHPFLQSSDLTVIHSC